MNNVLKEILETRLVSDGVEQLPLRSEMDKREGALLSRMVESVRPTTSLEVGFAYGVSTLYICDALARIGQPARHIAIDPFQSTQWKGIGLRNLERAGYARYLELREERSEIALPKLLMDDTKLDLALIDGWHTFDHALVDFFYINKMLRIGGVVIFDDASWPSVGKLVNHLATYGCYRIVGVRSERFSLPFWNERAVLIARRLAYYLGLKSSKWPPAIAFEKIREDSRNYNWHKGF